MKQARAWVYMALTVLWAHGALASILPIGYAQGMALLLNAGLSVQVSTLAIWAGVCADTVMALATMYAWQSKRFAAVYQLSCIGLITVYTVLGSVLAPQLWHDPMGALTKNIPMIAFSWLMYKGEKNGLHNH